MSVPSCTSARQVHVLEQIELTRLFLYEIKATSMETRRGARYSGQAELCLHCYTSLIFMSLHWLLSSSQKKHPHTRGESKIDTNSASVRVCACVRENEYLCLCLLVCLCLCVYVCLCWLGVQTTMCCNFVTTIASQEMAVMHMLHTSSSPPV